MKSTTERGYGSKHQRERARWQKVIDRGEGVCWRCSRPIPPGAHWDLGHDDNDRTVYRGPEHRHCNRRAAALRGNAQRSTPVTKVTTLRW